MSAVSIFAGVCVFFSSALVGLWLKRRFLRKATFYEEYYRYLVYTCEKISYERMPVAEIKSTFAKRENTEFSAFCLGRTPRRPSRTPNLRT